MTFLTASMLLAHALMATLSEDLLSTRLLGQRFGPIDAPQCVLSPSVQDLNYSKTYTCDFALLGQQSTVRFLLQGLPGHALDLNIVGWSIVVPNISQRDQALLILNPLLQAYARVYPRYEKIESAGILRWYFTDAKRSTTVVEFASSNALEHRINIATRFCGFPQSSATSPGLDLRSPPIKQ